MRQPNVYSTGAVGPTPVAALVAATRTLAQMAGGEGVVGAVVGYEAKVEVMTTSPAMLGDEPVDAVVEYAATITAKFLPEETPR